MKSSRERAKEESSELICNLKSVERNKRFSDKSFFLRRSCRSRFIKKTPRLHLHVRTSRGNFLIFSIFIVALSLASDRLFYTREQKVDNGQWLSSELGISKRAAKGKMRQMFAVKLLSLKWFGVPYNSIYIVNGKSRGVKAGSSLVTVVSNWVLKFSIWNWI